jgi:hypothetical protein
MLVAMLLCFSGTLLAETLSGRVSDSGEPLAGVEVTLIDAGNNVIVKTARTGVDGRYRLSVDAGAYKLRASKSEYSDVWVKDIAVNATDITIDIVMNPAVFDDETYVAPSDGCD